MAICCMMEIDGHWQCRRLHDGTLEIGRHWQCLPVLGLAFDSESASVGVMLFGRTFCNMQHDGRNMQHDGSGMMGKGWTLVHCSL